MAPLPSNQCPTKTVAVSDHGEFAPWHVSSLESPKSIRSVWSHSFTSVFMGKMPAANKTCVMVAPGLDVFESPRAFARVSASPRGSQATCTQRSQRFGAQTWRGVFGSTDMKNIESRVRLLPSPFWVPTSNLVSEIEDAKAHCERL